jgi:hypothetical protein
MDGTATAANAPTVIARDARTARVRTDGELFTFPHLLLVGELVIILLDTLKIFAVKFQAY